MIAVREAQCGRASGIDPFAAAGVAVQIDHAMQSTRKPMVIGRTVAPMGAMNWTRGAAANPETLKRLSSPVVATAYAAIGASGSPSPCGTVGGTIGPGSRHQKAEPARAYAERQHLAAAQSTSGH